MATCRIWIGEGETLREAVMQAQDACNAVITALGNSEVVSADTTWRKEKNITQAETYERYQVVLTVVYQKIDTTIADRIEKLTKQAAKGTR